MARRSGLGKGLSALIPTEIPGKPTSALREVPIGSIRPNPRQPRTYFDEEAMSALAASIRELGILQPVLVKELPGKPTPMSSSPVNGGGGPRGGPGSRPSPCWRRPKRGMCRASSRPSSRTYTGRT